jgi:hypothetical protein
MGLLVKPAGSVGDPFDSHDPWLAWFLLSGTGGLLFLCIPGSSLYLLLGKLVERFEGLPPWQRCLLSLGHSVAEFAHEASRRLLQGCL